MLLKCPRIFEGTMKKTAMQIRTSLVLLCVVFSFFCAKPLHFFGHLFFALKRLLDIFHCPRAETIT